MPAIAYLLDMNYRTGGSYGLNELIAGAALGVVVWPLFAVQPLTIVGVTGLINLVNYTQYDIVVGHYGFDRMAYLRFQAWTLIWAAAFHFLVAVLNICDFTRFITDMTSNTFGFYVGIVYIQKGIELLIEEFEPLPLDNATGWLSVTIAILFTVSVYWLEKVGKTSYLPFRLRSSVAGYAFIAGILFWTGFSHFPDHSLRQIPIARVPTTAAFLPTLDRSWFLDFWNIELKWVFIAAPFGFLIMLLFYFDHNVSSVMSQARQFPVKTPAGFHWDFFLLGLTTLVSGFLGLPAPNGLVPQAPVHTDTLSVYKQVNVGKGRPQEVRNVRVVEQRVSHLLIGLLTVASLTQPWLTAFGLMPRAVFAGVFILVGWGSIEDNNIVSRTLAVFQDRKMADPAEPLLKVRRSKVLFYVGIQWFFFAMTIAISQTIAAVGFPVIITLLIPFRYYIVPKFFSPEELAILDAPTADAAAVLASLGHEPERVTGVGVRIAQDTKIAGSEWDREADEDLDYRYKHPDGKTSALSRTATGSTTCRRGTIIQAFASQVPASVTAAALVAVDEAKAYVIGDQTDDPGALRAAAAVEAVRAMEGAHGSASTTLGAPPASYLVNEVHPPQHEMTLTPQPALSPKEQKAAEKEEKRRAKAAAKAEVARKLQLAKEEQAQRKAAAKAGLERKKLERKASKAAKGKKEAEANDPAATLAGAAALHTVAEHVKSDHRKAEKAQEAEEKDRKTHEAKEAAAAAAAAAAGAGTLHEIAKHVKAEKETADREKEQKAAKDSAIASAGADSLHQLAERVKSDQEKEEEERKKQEAKEAAETAAAAAAGAGTLHEVAKHVKAEQAKEDAQVANGKERTAQVVQAAATNVKEDKTKQAAGQDERAAAAAAAAAAKEKKVCFVLLRL